MLYTVQQSVHCTVSTPVSYTHLDVYKRQGEQGRGNFLLLKIIVEGGGENFLYVYYVIGNKEVVFC